jgi:type 1 glutamine amidotransferase
MLRSSLFTVAFLILGCSAVSAAELRVLVFSRTTGFRHDSIPAGIALIQRLGREHGFAVEATENPRRFTPKSLRAFRVVVFLNTTGDVLDARQQSALEGWVRGGGGWVGVHSAADTEHSWPFYGKLLGEGAWFAGHPAIQTAAIEVESATHPSAAHLPPRFSFADEWYNFRVDPRGFAHVLLSIDETTYDPGAGAMGDHPIAWYRRLGKGRAWYTNLGHRIETYAEPAFVQHLLGGITWAAARNR